MFTQYIASIRGIKSKHTSTVFAGFLFFVFIRVSSNLRSSYTQIVKIYIIIIIINALSYIRAVKFIGRGITRVESKTKLCWASEKYVFSFSSQLTAQMQTIACAFRLQLAFILLVYL